MKRLILILICLYAVGIVSQAQTTNGVTLDIVNLRAEPSVGNNVLGELAIDSPVTIVGRNANGAWLYVESDGGAGWVSSRYIDWDGIALMFLPTTDATVSTPSDNSNSQVQVVVAVETVRVTAKTRLNVRSTPSTSGTILTILNYNQVVTAIGRNGDGSWIAVDTGDSRGWVASAYLYSAGNLNDLTVRDVLSNDRVTTVPLTNAPAQIPMTRTGEYVITGPAPNNSTSYDMEITLHWNTTANLDLRITGPDGYLIVPGAPPSPTGGYFQQAVGANEDCTTAEGAALEVITWDKGTAPSGLYHIEVEHANSCFPEQEEDTRFWMWVKNDGPEVEFWVYLIEPGELFEFDFVRP